ncbi:MAG: hypothetical protein AAGG51_04295 [Cyanobacteria bacterium P01_G01_bin.54]
MDINFLYVWLGGMSLAMITAPLVRKRRGESPPNEQAFIAAGFALGGAIALFKVLAKVISQEELQDDLDWDGTIAICISSGMGIYLSLKEIMKLF